MCIPSALLMGMREIVCVAHTVAGRVAEHRFLSPPAVDVKLGYATTDKMERRGRHEKSVVIPVAEIQLKNVVFLLP